MKEFYKAKNGILFDTEKKCIEYEKHLEKQKKAPKFTIKRFEFYTVDLEPLSIENAKGLIINKVFNRISTNSIVIWKEVKEIPMFEEWHDNIKWNMNDTDIKEYDKLFEEWKK